METQLLLFSSVCHFSSSTIECWMTILLAYRPTLLCVNTNDAVIPSTSPVHAVMVWNFLDDTIRCACYFKHLSDAIDMQCFGCFLTVSFVWNNIGGINTFWIAKVHNFKVKGHDSKVKGHNLKGRSQPGISTKGQKQYFGFPKVVAPRSKVMTPKSKVTTLRSKFMTSRSKVNQGSIQKVKSNYK